MRTAAKVGLSIGAIFGSGILFAVLAPEQTHSVVNRAVKSFSLEKTAGEWHHHHGFMGKDYSALKAVDWETVKAAKMGFFERAKKAQSAEEVRPLAAGLRARVVKAGVPADHVDSMVNRWVEAAGSCNGKEGAEKDECYKKAAECHHGSMGKENSAWKDVDWETFKAAKMGFFERAKKAQSAEEVRPLAAGLRALIVKTGVPEDHVDHMVNGWVEAAGACNAKEGAEKDECYKTAVEWHHHHGFMGTENSAEAKAWKAVDWETVKAAKMDFFERAKKAQSAEEVRPLAAELRAEVVKAGVPADHVDYMVNRWVEAAGVKEFEAQPAQGGATDTECAKYEGNGELAVDGCSKCAKYYPGRTDQCMTCGGICARKVCEESTLSDCVKIAPFIECHRECMVGDAPEQRSYLKLLRLKMMFSAMYHEFWNLFEQVFLFMG
jgi:hypothetical protein